MRHMAGVFEIQDIET